MDCDLSVGQNHLEGLFHQVTGPCQMGFENHWLWNVGSKTLVTSMGGYSGLLLLGTV